mmetsp:Transcript_86344/g.241461  ORF Transcript_86344/g.241461 Transcript_86344/m.241461 type:complete len:260 (+) Transcript_86344:1560-2339(+)
MHPSDQNQAPARFAHAAHFAHELILVGHVLAALEGPHEVEGVIGKGHMQGVGHEKATGFPLACRLRKRLCLLPLLAAQGYASGGAAEFSLQVSSRPPDATANVQHRQWRARGACRRNRRPTKHLLDHGYLRQAVVRKGALETLRVKPMVKVLAPNLHPDPCRRVVKVRNALLQSLRRGADAAVQGNVPAPREPNSGDGDKASKRPRRARCVAGIAMHLGGLRRHFSDSEALGTSHRRCKRQARKLWCRAEARCHWRRRF